MKTCLWVAPPRGERGLKYENTKALDDFGEGRSPSWGAWIEIYITGGDGMSEAVAPPRGERGLK